MALNGFRAAGAILIVCLAAWPAMAQNIAEQIQLCRGAAEERDARLAACTAVLASDRVPDRVPFLKVRGFLYLQTGAFDSAIADLDETLRLEPGEAVVYVSRGLAHSGNGDLEEALADFDQALALDGDNAEALFYRGTTYAVMDAFEQAIADYDAALRIDPDFATVHIYRGYSYDALGDHDAALAAFSEAIRIDPQLSDAYAARAASHAMADDSDSALADYNEAVRLDPENARVTYMRGNLLFAQDRYEEAAADFDTAMRLDPEFAPPYNDKAWLRATAPAASMRDGTEAVVLAQRAVELFDTPEYRDTLAAAYAEAGDFEKAAEQQRIAIRQLRDGGADAFVPDFESRLNLYVEGRPYRE